MRVLFSLCVEEDLCLQGTVLHKNRNELCLEGTSPNELWLNEYVCEMKLSRAVASAAAENLPWAQAEHVLSCVVDGVLAIKVPLAHFFLSVHDA